MENQTQNNKDGVNTPIQNMLASTQKDSTMGPLIGSIIIILIVIIGGLYFLGSLVLNKKNKINSLQEESSILEIKETVKQSTSTDLDILEADLKAIDTEKEL